MTNDEWIDVSDEIELKNGKANPFGWSVSEIHHNGNKIGHHCSITIDDPLYKFTITPEDGHQRLTIYKLNKTPPATGEVNNGGS